MANLGLYVHIPFCAQKCAYCDFYSLPGAGEQEMDRYLKALLSHMSETSSFTGKKAKGGGWTVDTVYFGGGTPSLFGAKRLKTVLSAVFKLWNISNSAEISMEGNPESLDAKSLKKLRRAGFNRLSVGVQSTHQAQLEALGRKHTAEQAADCVREAKKAGFENISVDLMYGVPGQDAEALYDTLRAILTWDVQHISLYGLKLEEGTPLFDRRDSLSLPDDDEQALVYLAAAEFLEREGFAQYEISNFSRPDRVCRHNMKYWTLQPYIGFGPAAHSDFGGRRYGHVKSLDEYIEGISKGGAVISEMNVIPPLERAGEYIMCGLRTVRGISGNEYVNNYKVSLDPVEKKLEIFAAHGFAKQEGGRWRLTPRGFLVSNRILSELLSIEVDNTLSFTD